MTPAYHKDATLTQAIRAVAHSARSRGIMWCGAPGVGKSQGISRVAVQDFAAGVPQCILDPTGSTIDYFLNKVVEIHTYLPRCEGAKLFERIVYCDMSGKDGFVIPFPSYYRVGTERSLWEIAERFPQALVKNDPALRSRPIMGWPPMHKISVYAGMILFAVGCQITQAESLLLHPEHWEERFQQAEERFPTVKSAVAYFRDEYPHLRKAERERLTNPLLEKLFPISSDQRLQALFGASQPGINWDEVERKQQTVLIDFRHVGDTDMRRLLLLWMFSSPFEWIKGRGRRTTPFGVIIDEFPQMAGHVSAGDNPLVAAFDTLIHTYMRSSQIWLTLGLQSPLQLDEQLRQTVLSLGTYLVGQATTMEAVRLLADALYLRDPYWVKHYRKVYVPQPRWAAHRAIDDDPPKEPEYMPLEQQTELFAQRIRRLKQYQFLFRPAVDEGTVGTAVYPISIRTIDTGKFPDQGILQQLRKTLAAKAGIPVDVLIKEQEARLQQPPVARAAHPDHQVREQPLRNSNGTDAPAAQPAEERPRRLLQRRYL